MNGSSGLAWPAALAGSLFLSAAGSAMAQDTPDTVESLSKRVAELEAKLPKAPPAGTPAGSGTTKLGSMFTLYGYLRVDMVYDDSRPNDPQLPVFIRSEDQAAPAAFGQPKNSENFNMHPKLTRLGIDFNGPKIGGLGDAQITGKLETDFYGATTSESRQALRIRVAYTQLKWNEFSLYGGQMWDVISPLMPIVNPDMVMWGAGNLADRRPQIRGEWVHALGDAAAKTALTVTGMIGTTSAVVNENLDGNAYRDGDQSGVPTLQGRVGWKKPTAAKGLMDFGAWAHRAIEDVDGTVGGQSNFQSSAYGVDFQVPLFEDRLWLKGELWAGRNLDDVRGGILQGVNASTGDEISSEGGWAEVGFKLADSHTTLHAGCSFDNPDNEDLTGSSTAPRSRNQIAYVACRWDFNPFYCGIDYLRWVTGYQGFTEGTDNRFQAYMQYSF